MLSDKLNVVRLPTSIHSELDLGDQSQLSHHQPPRPERGYWNFIVVILEIFLDGEVREAYRFNKSYPRYLVL